VGGHVGLVAVRQSHEVAAVGVDLGFDVCGQRLERGVQRVNGGVHVGVHQIPVGHNAVRDGHGAVVDSRSQGAVQGACAVLHRCLHRILHRLHLPVDQILVGVVSQHEVLSEGQIGAEQHIHTVCLLVIDLCHYFVVAGCYVGNYFVTDVVE